MDDVRFAVIGAGMAGLACAHELARADARVTVFERCARPGRATRHASNADHSRSITARNSSRRAAAPSVVTRRPRCEPAMLDAWRPRIMEDDRAWPAPIEDWWIGQPGMSALVRPLARNIEIHERRRRPRTDPEPARLGTADRLGRQKRDLSRRGGRSAGAAGVFAARCRTAARSRHIADVRMAPCWTGMYAFDPPIDAGADARRWTTAGPLVGPRATPASRNGRAPPQCWVVHASSGWTRQHIDLDAKSSSEPVAAGVRGQPRLQAADSRAPGRASLASRAGGAAARPVVPGRRGTECGCLWRLVHRTTRRGRLRERPQPGSLAPVDGRTCGAHGPFLTAEYAQRAGRRGRSPQRHPRAPAQAAPE